MRRQVAVAVLVAGSVLGCTRGEPNFTLAEAADTAAEAAGVSGMLTAVGASVEVGAAFVIGDTPEQAAASIAGALATDTPCAVVSVDGADVAISYDGSCSYRGQPLVGTQGITVVANDAEEVIVDHSWEGLDNGLATVTGAAEVAWTADDETRYIAAELTWTVTVDGRSGDGAGEWAQGPVLGGPGEGIAVEGYLDWVGMRGNWNADLRPSEVRWIDPFPQVGSWVIDTAHRKVATTSFARIDASTLEVAVAGPSQTFRFDIGAPDSGE